MKHVQSSLPKAFIKMCYSCSIFMMLLLCEIKVQHISHETGLYARGVNLIS